ncbi:unnamed protein product [Peniophora sp. CBMAI 1063]|nr:unnamed protein product [Peniophora sp. CBMAI 1063]
MFSSPSGVGIRISSSGRLACDEPDLAKKHPESISHPVLLVVKKEVKKEVGVQEKGLGKGDLKIDEDEEDEDKKNWTKHVWTRNPSETSQKEITFRQALLIEGRLASKTILYVRKCAPSSSSGRRGATASNSTFAGTDEQTLIPYILTALNDTELAFKFASRGNSSGADDLHIKQYQQLFQSGNFGEAAKIATNSPGEILRTARDIESFKQMPAPPSGTWPILQYFGILPEKGKLNDLDKELGDIVRLHDLILALSVYLRANVPNEVIACFAETGQTDKILLYANKVGFHPDYVGLLQHIMRTNPDKGAEFAARLVNNESGPLIDVERVVDIFMAQNMIQPATSFLLDALKENKPEQGHSQTRLLEMNFLHAPQVPDAILGDETFSHYDRPRIANLVRVCPAQKMRHMTRRYPRREHVRAELIEDGVPRTPTARMHIHQKL